MLGKYIYKIYPAIIVIAVHYQELSNQIWSMRNHRHKRWPSNDKLIFFVSMLQDGLLPRQLCTYGYK